MGYFTYKLLRDVSTEQVKDKVFEYLRQFEAASPARKIAVHLLEGESCVALSYGYLGRENLILSPIGWQLGCVWMDVELQDGDSWQVTLFDGSEHRCTHNVNPWATNRKPVVNLKDVEFRIRRICEAWPLQATRIENYLLLWREAVRHFVVTQWVPRTGKAYVGDQFNYGDANQMHDFMRAFGIGESTHSEKLSLDS